MAVQVLAETDLGAMKRMEMQRQLPGRNHPGRADEKVRKVCSCTIAWFGHQVMVICHVRGTFACPYSSAAEPCWQGGYGNFEEELSKETTAKCTEAMKLMLPENLLRMFDVLKSGQTWDGAARPNTLL